MALASRLRPAAPKLRTFHLATHQVGAMLFGAAMLQRFGWLKVVQLVESAVYPA